MLWKTNRVSAVLVSRFLLHLQTANLRARGLGSSQSLENPSGGSVIFERVIGSVGAQIAPEDYFDSDDMEFENGSREIDGCGERVEE